MPCSSRLKPSTGLGRAARGVIFFRSFVSWSVLFDTRRVRQAGGRGWNPAPQGAGRGDSRAARGCPRDSLFLLGFAAGLRRGALLLLAGGRARGLRFGALLAALVALAARGGLLAA